MSLLVGVSLEYPSAPALAIPQLMPSMAYWLSVTLFDQLFEVSMSANNMVGTCCMEARTP